MQRRIMLAAAVLVAGCWIPASASKHWSKEWPCKNWGSPKFFEFRSHHTSNCLERGADPNKAVKGNWMAPIFIASKYTDDVDAIHELFKAGVDPLAKDSYYGNTPLHMATVYTGIQNIDTIKALLDYGADPNARNIYGNTPLLLAFSGKKKHEPSSELVELLLETGADPNLQNQNGESAMTRVTSLNNRKLLVMAGAMYNPARKQRSGTLTGIMTGLGVSNCRCPDGPYVS